MKKFFAIIMSVLMMACFMPSMAFATGETTWADNVNAQPAGYTIDAAAKTVAISSAEGLAWFAKVVNGTTGADSSAEDFASYTITLTNNIDLSGKEWTPIGNGSRSSKTYTGSAFKGTFDGNGKIISGLKITTGSGDAAIGLFGVVAGGTVKDLVLEKVSISASGDELAGGVVGFLVDNGAIENVNVSGTISAEAGVGGIVGRMIIEATISDCVNGAEVTGVQNVGGIVGAAYYTAADKEMKISNCTNSGTITGTNVSIGGIGGLSAANISYCKNTGKIEGTGNKSFKNSVGGIVGGCQSYGSVRNCKNEATVSISGVNATVGAGGIVGWIQYSGKKSSYERCATITIQDNTNMGSVASSGSSAGGIVGQVQYKAIVTGNKNYAETISSTDYAAGIVGRVEEYNNSAVKEDNNAEKGLKVTITDNLTTTRIDSKDAECFDGVVWNTVNKADRTDIEYTKTNNIAGKVKIGDTGYWTLAEAISANEDENTITLLDNVTEGITIPTGKTVTINIAGHTLSGSATVAEGGKLIIKDSAGTGKIAFDPSSYLESGYYASKTTDGGTTYWTIKKYTYSGGGSSSSTTTTTTDTVTNTTEDKKTDTSTDTGSTTETAKVATTTATVKTETKTAADGTKTVAATVDTTTATKIVEKAVENKSEEVVINTATTSSSGTAAVTETAAGTTTKVDLPEQTVKAIAEKTEAAVTIKSDAAEIKLNTEAVKAVAEQAGDTGTVNLVVETVAQSESKVEVDLKLVTSQGNVTDFRGGSVSVTVKLNTALAAKPVVCVYIDDFGTYHKVKGVKNADGTFTFETGHFSTYAVIAEEEADGVIAEQTANVEKLAGDLTLKARSEKTEKGNIKVTLTVDEDAIEQVEDLGYTVKYKFYRSTKKSASYKAALEKTGKTYTNTTGKKGTKYYYKARVMVYNAQGALVTKSELKQCRYASRTK